MNLMRLAASLLALLAFSPSAFPRGAGTETYVISPTGKLVAELGNTRGALIDEQANVIFRFQDKQVTAAPLDRPKESLWSVPANPKLAYQTPHWRLLDQLLVLFEEDKIMGLDRRTGKSLYSTETGEFTSSRNSPPAIVNADHGPKHCIYLVNNLAQGKRSQDTLRDSDAEHPDREPVHAATLAKFDLAAGKFLWKSSLVTADGKKFLPKEVDPQGIVRGQLGEVYYFDPESGKSLDKPLEKPAAEPSPEPLASPLEARLLALPDGVAMNDAEGKRLWSFPAPADTRSEWLISGQTILLPQTILNPQQGSIEGKVTALDAKNGQAIWTFKLPRAGFADKRSIHITPAQAGFLVRYHWLILD